MGNSVDKIAFQPPDRQYALDLLKPDDPDTPIRYVVNRNGTRVSYFHFCVKQEKETGVSAAAGSASSSSSPPTTDASSAGSSSASRLTVLWVHGNAEDLGYGFSTYRRLFHKLELDIVAFDYSGYGCSDGTASEKNAYADIDAMFEYMTQTCRIPTNRIVVIGRSLGSGPAVDLASRTPDLAGLVLISPIASACSVAGSVPGFVLKSIDIFRNRDKVRFIRNFPVLIIHGRVDTVVPFAHGQLLHSILTAPASEGGAQNTQVRTWWVDRCGHNDIEAIEGERFYTNLKQFIRSLLAFTGDERLSGPAIEASPKANPTGWCSA